MSAEQPLLSIVVTSRNDNHGKNLLRRMQTFINGFINQCKRHHIQSELIIVEWNPPTDRARLVDVLQWPDDAAPCEVRIIEVPAQLHDRLENAEKMPLFQMIAKNVGIRRAKGKYVLATNLDILFSDELMHYIKSGQLKPGKMYRIDRHDVMEDVPVDGTVEEQLSYCESHLLRVNAATATHPLHPNGEFAVAPNDVVAEQAGVVFETGWMAPAPYPGGVFRNMGPNAELAVHRRPKPHELLCLDMEPGPSMGLQRCEIKVLDKSGNVVANFIVRQRKRVFLNLPLSDDVPGPERFTFHVDGGGLPVPNCPHIINARVFRCSWVETETPSSQMRVGVCDSELGGHWFDGDFVQSDTPIGLISGWNNVEVCESDRYRWTHREAVLSLYGHLPQSPILSFELEAGQSVGHRPFTLQLIDSDGEVAAEGIAKGRCRFRMQLNNPPERRAKYTLRVKCPRFFDRTPTHLHCYRLFNMRWENISIFAAMPNNTGCSTNVKVEYYRQSLKFRLYQFTLFRWLRKVAKNLLRRGTNGELSQPAPNCLVQSGEIVSPFPIHTNACGDFTMLAREDWFRMQGNPEHEIFSLHLDSLFCYQAFHAGIEEVILPDPMRIYHIEHSTGSGWTPEGQNKLMEKLEERKIPVLQYEQLVQWAIEMRQQNRPIQLNNNENWGMSEHVLSETNPHRLLRTVA